jgi:hypothetical protein
MGKRRAAWRPLKKNENIESQMMSACLLDLPFIAQADFGQAKCRKVVSAL